MLRIALVGQPNCGKSTIFNHLVGYKANTSNLPGTTVTYMKSTALIDGKTAEVIDLPGTYSLTSLDRAEVEARNYLLEGGVDAVLNVVDASLLSRGLELTLQLLELGLPVVVCLNMADEAKRKGIAIDTDALERRLGVPVVSAIAVRGVGVRAAASGVVKAARDGEAPRPPTYSADVERLVGQLAERIAQDRDPQAPAPTRLFAVKLLEADPGFTARARPLWRTEAKRLGGRLQTLRGRSGEDVISAERHHLAMSLFEACATVGESTLGLRDRLDSLMMHRVFGILFFAGIMYALFFVVFKVGSIVEGEVMQLFDRSLAALAGVLATGSLPYFVAQGVIQGIAGAVGIVLPYLVPFLIGLALLEDTGYLPRAGYLMDGLMHKIGLHGKSIIPFVLGYGCSVPAVMATRILDSPRDRFITAMLSVMVPCTARTTVIFGLVGYFLGPTLAFLLYVINLVVLAIAGALMTRVFPRITPGLILEIPSYKVPSLRVVLSNVWLRLREFVVMAWPLLIGGSIVLSLLEYVHATHYLNLALLPITWTLGLPVAIGVTLIFGILRKELTLIMLFQALGTTQVASVLTGGQMMTFTLFVMFYIPCVATIAVLTRELGRGRTALVLAATTGTALAVALIARGVAAIIG